jgi:chromosome segregation ATPase
VHCPRARAQAADAEVARLLAEAQRQRAASGGAQQELQRWQRAASHAAEEAAGLRLRLGALDGERASLEQALRSERRRSADLEAVTRQVNPTYKRTMAT